MVKKKENLTERIKQLTLCVEIIKGANGVKKIELIKIGKGSSRKNMKMKKIPMRTCVITKEKLPKQELIRVVRTPDGNIIIDQTGKVNGRGAYLKKDLQTFEKAQKSKILNRQLEVEIPNSIYEELKTYCMQHRQ